MKNEIVYTELDRDYPKGYWTGAVTVTKVRNAMAKAGLELANARNDRLNNVRTGMTGFVKAKDGRVVYVSQDCSGAGDSRFLYRAARHDRDWTGGRNNFCEPRDLVRSVSAMLECSPEFWEGQF